jgi:hypothetical protein
VKGEDEGTQSSPDPSLFTLQTARPRKEVESIAMENRPTADFVIELPGRGIQLLVEAKNTPAPSREWAGRYLRNLFAHADLPATEFFLLALRDHLYLWRHPKREARPPDFEGDTATALEPYLRGLQLGTLNERSFELIIHAWLSDLVSGSAESEGLKWLKDSGLSDLVRNGTIRTQIAA